MSDENIKNLHHFFQHTNLSIDQSNQISQVFEQLLSKEQIQIILEQSSEVEIKQNNFFQVDSINFSQLNKESISFQNLKVTRSQEISETDSLSLIQSDQQQLNLNNSIEWEQILKEYGNFFKQSNHQKNYIQTCTFNDILNNQNNLIIHKGTDSILMTGYNFEIKNWVVLKVLTLKNKSIVEAAQQYLIHDQIFKLYPDLFLRLLLPVYVKQTQQEHLEFTSQLEYGRINLYDYSQQHQITDLEQTLIFQQIYQQIKLLHRHNIAHRDIKPQNIIFVDNKGWLLCDFGDSKKYENVIGIYNIRGTYSFLQPHVQQLAKIEGISTKQNLYINDLYALAITLLVIKYQIKNSDQIDQYLKNDEDLIVQYLRDPIQLINIESEKNNYELKFIQSQSFKQSKNQNPKSYQYFVSMIWVLKNQEHFPQLTQVVIDQIKLQIDEKLGSKDEHWYSLNTLCYLRLHSQAKNFKNIIKFQNIKKRIKASFKHYEFWQNRIIQSSKLPMQQQMRQCLLQLLIILFEFGYTDFVLQHCRIFLKNDYDFTVHIILINLLNYLQQHDQAKYEYNLLLNYRDYKYMNEEEFDMFNQLTVNEYPNSVKISDIQYLKNHIEIRLIGLYDFQVRNIDADDLEFINKFMNEFQKSSKKFEFPSYKVQLMFKFFYEFVNMKSVSFNLLFIQRAKSQIKYYCDSFYWQKIISLFCENLILIGKQNKIKKYIKKMNYNLLFNSESKIQEQVIKIIKLSVIVNSGIKSKSKQLQIISNLLQIIKNLDQINVRFYKFIILQELIRLINDEVFDRDPKNGFKLMTYICRKPDFIKIFNEQQQVNLTQIAHKCFQVTMNIKRLLKLWKIRLYERINITNLRLLYKKRKYKKMQKQFLLAQYFR